MWFNYVQCKTLEKQGRAFIRACVLLWVENMRGRSLMGGCGAGKGTAVSWPSDVGTPIVLRPNKRNVLLLTRRKWADLEKQEWTDGWVVSVVCVFADDISLSPGGFGCGPVYLCPPPNKSYGTCLDGCFFYGGGRHPRVKLFVVILFFDG